MKIKKCIEVFFVSLFFFCFFSSVKSVNAASPQPVPTPPVPTLPSGAEVLSWDLVGLGKKIDWKGDSANMKSLQVGFDKWNAINSVFRKKGLLSVANLKISDVWMIQADGIVQKDLYALTKQDGTLQFATGNMELLNTYKKHHVAVHELGHALGLADQTVDSKKNTVMYNKPNETYDISQLERDTFDYLYRLRY